MGTYISPFDFETIIVGHLLGSYTLFIYAFIFFTSILCAYFRMPNQIYFILLAIGSIMFSVFLGQGVYVITIMLIGFLTFKGVAKLVSQ